MFRAVVLAGLVAMLCSSPAFAQAVPPPSDDPVASAPFHLGAFGLDPRLGISNLGVDTNVFNSVNDPQQDFTFTVPTDLDVWLRTGRGLLSLTGGLDFVYFHEFDSERSINSNARGQYEFRFNRMRPYASASTLNTRERPGYEIDARARHYETDFHVGTDLRAASKSTLRLDFRYLDYRFAGDEVFNGQALYEELNRILKAAELSWRQRLTALTTWVTRFSRETERFEFEDFRNSDSLRLSSGFELGRFALIRGSAFAGFRKLTPADGGILPEFSGITADVSVSYTMPSQTRLGVDVDRDVQYSYEEITPYYVQTGWTATLTQRITGRWDFQLSGGRDRLAYEAIIPVDARTDFIGRFGGGIGYAMGDQIRASFDVNSFHRSSPDPRREYGGIRAGVSVIYGY
jgi:hypothetical protein